MNDRHVVIVGGGVIGLTVAYYLKRAGASVTVIERSSVGSGASWGNAGWIVPTFSAPLPAPGMAWTAMRALASSNGSFYISLRHLPGLAPWLWRFWRSSTSAKHLHGLLATAALAWPTHRLYEELAAEGVDFEMSPSPILYAFLHGTKAEHIRRRNILPLVDLGYPQPSATLDGPELRDIEPALGGAVEAGFLVPGERTVSPPSLLAGLKARLTEMGIEIREHDPVSGFVTREGRVVAVRGSGSPVDADDVVLAAGVWTRKLARQLGVRIPLQPGKGYSFTISTGTTPAHCLYLYEARVSVSPSGSSLRLAGTMELSGMSADVGRGRIDAVARAARPYLAGWDRDSLREEWAGLRPMTPDGLPVLGRAGTWRNLYLATGHGMLGVTLAPATGWILARLIVDGDDAEVLRPFRLDRFVTWQRSPIHPRHNRNRARDIS